MSGSGGQELPPRNGGEFLLRLVQQNPPQTSSSPHSLQPQPQPQPHGVSLDPAVAAVGPTIPFPMNGHHYPAPPPNHRPCPWPQLEQQQQQQQLEQQQQLSSLMLGKMPFNQDPTFDFDLQPNSLPFNQDAFLTKPPEIRHQPGPPPGFTARSTPINTPTQSHFRTAFGVYHNDHPKSPLPPSSTPTVLHSPSASQIKPNAHLHTDILELSQHFGESSLVDEHDETSDKKKHRDKDFRSDPRGNRTLSQRMRNSKSYIQCRSDIHRFNSHFLDIYESLIPASEEKAKQKQLLSLLEKLVCKEWPNARLYLYGSCANSFGVSKSDIDVCLAIADQDINKSEILLKLADILQSDNLENVQALTRARVPIVKLKDPVTGISCDICINNVLAVVNTKLLRDYAEIDARLRQLAFIVKHWAKSRAVNETYQGTLSSYAYVLMCIHFLQQRRPAILPCLQEMDRTYTVTVDDVKCAYFDQVERLQNFGGRNKENIAQLVWAFFNYWAYCHDYANSVISVRTGSFLSKQEKDWTRRVGNERHLICIEDPFETSHDLGRVVDKHSIRVLREEFERAAYILQSDPNPCAELFRPYVPS